MQETNCRAREDCFPGKPFEATREQQITKKGCVPGWREEQGCIWNWLGIALDEWHHQGTW